MLKIYLQLKYWFLNKFPAKYQLRELHNHYKRHPVTECQYRAELLYYWLKNQNHSPIIWRYDIKDNIHFGLGNSKFKFKHINGDLFGFHYVVELDGNIYDPNLFLVKPVKKDDFEKFCLSYSDKTQIYSSIENPQHDIAFLKNVLIFTNPFPFQELFSNDTES